MAVPPGAGGRRARHRRSWVFGFVTVAAFLALAGWGRLAGAAGSTMFTGTVRTESGAAVAGATVSLVDASTLAVLATTSTGADGTYSLSTSSSTAVKLSFAKAGSATVWNGNRPTAATAAALTPNGTAISTDAVLDVAGSIQGTVSHGDNGLAQMWVIVTPGDLNTSVAGTLTDTSGHYVVSVPVGQYKVRFADPANLSNPAVGYHVELYPNDGTNTFAKGATVDVHASTATVDIDAGLSSVADCKSTSFTSSANLTGKDLADCSAAGANLGFAILTDAGLQHADLTGAQLGYAGLRSVHAHRASFRRANLGGARAVSADLRGADLTGANLNAADLSNADLLGATLTGASISGTVWSNTRCPDGSNSSAHASSCAGSLGGATFTVDSTADVADDSPGDGRCHTVFATCTLRAAVMEANALPTTSAINLAHGAWYSLQLRPTNVDTDDTGDLDVRGDVTINGNQATISTLVDARAIEVFASGSLHLNQVAIAQARVENRSLLTIDGGVLQAMPRALLNVGTIEASSLTVIAGGIENRAGTTTIVDATLAQSFSTATSPALAAPAGSLKVTNSIVSGVCTGAVSSGDFNLATDPSCAFGLGHDSHQPITLMPRQTPAVNWAWTLLVPPLGSGAVDRGRFGCTGVDAFGTPRPADGDGDGTAQCDRGAVELPTYLALHLTVDDAADADDANPGDHVCATATGTCTLRAALTEVNRANGRHDITLPSNSTISATSTFAELLEPVTILGQGATVTMPSGVAAFSSDIGVPFELDDATLTGGSSYNPNPKAIAGGSSVTLNRAHLKGFGTAISTLGSVTVTDSSLEDGAVGIDTAGALTIRRSTVRAYVSTGIVARGTTTSVVSSTTIAEGGIGLSITAGTVYVTDSTVSAHTSSTASGAGIDVILGGSAVLTNTIVAQQKAGSDCAGHIVSNDYNLASDATCNLTGAHDLASTPAQLSPISVINPGGRFVVSPAAGSPAVDSGRPICNAIDGRGFARPADGDGDGVKRCDRGATELAPPTPLTIDVNSTANTPDAAPGDGVCQTATAGECTLRAAVMESDATNGADTINLATNTTYDAGIDSNGMLEEGAATGDLDLWSAVTINGNGSDAGSFDLYGGAPMNLNHLGPTFTEHGTPDLTLSYDFLGVVATKGPVHIDHTTGQRYFASVHAIGPLTMTDSVLSVDVVADGPASIARSAFRAHLTLNAAATLDRSLVVGDVPATIGSAGDVTVTSTTFSSVGQYGPTLSYPLVTVQPGGRLTLVDDTLAATGSGHAFDNDGGTVTMTNTIVSSAASQAACHGPVVSADYNLASDASCALTGPHDLQSTDADLLPPGSYPAYGSRPPNTGSPAIDTGRPGCAVTDEDGNPRPTDGDGDGTSSCDRGATEAATYRALDLVVNDQGTAHDAVPGDGVCQTATPGQCSYPAAIDEANAVNGRHVIRFATTAASAGGTLTFVRPITVDGGTGETLSQWNVATFGPGPFRFVHLNHTQPQCCDTMDNPSGSVTMSFTAFNSLAVTNGGTLTVDHSSGLGVTSTAALDVSDSNLLDTTTSGGTTIRRSWAVHLNVTAGTTTATDSSFGGPLFLQDGAVNVTGGAVTFTNVSVAHAKPNLNVSGSGSLTMTNSVVTDPRAGSTNCVGTVTSGGWNTVSDASCALGGANDVQASVTQIGLGPIVDNGGSSQSYLPLDGSVLIDSGPPSCGGTDQRGFARNQDGNGDTLAACDRGATEVSPVVPHTFDVNSTADKVDANPGDGVCSTTTAGECTLRAAVMEANRNTGADTINLQPTTYNLTIFGLQEHGTLAGDLDVRTGLTIHGNGATVADAGSNNDRLLDVFAPVVLHVDNLTLTNGRGSPGSAIENLGATVVVSSSLLSANVATNNNLLPPAAAVYNTGSFTLDHSTIRAGVSPTAGVTNEGVLTITSSTLSGNGGNGVRMTAGTATITTSTISGNAAAGVLVSGGTVTIADSTIANNAGGVTVTSGSASVTNTIIANQASGSNCAGTVSSSGFNLVSDASCSFAAGGDVQNVVVSLGALADNGGPTQTHLPAAGSAAVGTGRPGCTGFDQRGVARPQGGACDKGSVEQ